MKERSLIVLKPDVMTRGITGEIMTRFEKVGLKIIAMKMLQVPLDLAQKHYEKDDEWLLRKGKLLIENQNLDTEKEDPKQHGQKIVDSLAKDLTLSPVIAMILEGHNAIEVIRKMLGDMSPEHSMPGTIRGDYSHDTIVLANASNRPVINLVHGSDTKEMAEKEIKLWFRDEEIINWQKLDEQLHYRRQE
jgi:nucleoside-diphosphate kinase